MYAYIWPTLFVHKKWRDGVQVEKKKKCYINYWLGLSNKQIKLHPTSSQYPLINLLWQPLRPQCALVLVSQLPLELLETQLSLKVGSAVDNLLRFCSDYGVFSCSKRKYLNFTILQCSVDRQWCLGKKSIPFIVFC